jgi:hypothetical protein
VRAGARALQCCVPMALAAAWSVTAAPGVGVAVAAGVGAVALAAIGGLSVRLTPIGLGAAAIGAVHCFARVGDPVRGGDLLATAVLAVLLLVTIEAASAVSLTNDRARRATVRTTIRHALLGLSGALVVVTVSLAPADGTQWAIAAAAAGVAMVALGTRDVRRRTAP